MARIFIKIGIVNWWSLARFERCFGVAMSADATQERTLRGRVSIALSRSRASAGWPGLQIPFLSGEAVSAGFAFRGRVAARCRGVLWSAPGVRPRSPARGKRQRGLIQDKPSSRGFLASRGYWRQCSETAFHLPRIQPIRSAANPVLRVKINSCRGARTLCECLRMKPGEFSHKPG